MPKPFVVISGLPGSGKTTLGRRLAPALNLPLIDKDDILEHLFAAKGTGDAAWRRALSRESDEIFRREAEAVDAAILVSFWRLPGMAAESGTPAGWLLEISHPLVHVHCACPPEIAAGRFLRRTRHPGHLDPEATYEETLSSLRELSRLAPLDLNPRTDLDTSQEYDLEAVISTIRCALTR
jgi:glucokinase